MNCGEICGTIVGPDLARRNRTSNSGPDLRVLHIVTAFPRFSTDTITPWFVELVRRQRESGIDARVFAPAYRGGPETEPFPGIPVERFRYAPPALETLTHDESVPDRIRHSPAAGPSSRGRPAFRSNV